jgi:hypothetical protein
MVVGAYEFFCPTHRKLNKAAKDKRGRNTAHGRESQRRTDKKYYAGHREEILNRARIRYRLRRFLIEHKLIVSS